MVAMNRALVALACACAFVGFSAPAFGQETVHFQDNFSGDELDYSYDDGAGNWITRNWYDGSDYTVSDNKLYLGASGWVDSDYLNIIGTPNEMTFSGTWGGSGRALGMYIYDENSGSGLNIYHTYSDDGNRYLIIDDGTNWIDEVQNTNSLESDFSLHFDSTGWSFTDGTQTWSFTGNPLSAVTSGSSYFGVYAYDDDPTADSPEAYFANLKLSSPTVTPEPVSAGLFLLGGGALAVIRRKKA